MPRLYLVPTIGGGRSNRCCCNVKSSTVSTTRIAQPAAVAITITLNNHSDVLGRGTGAARASKAPASTAVTCNAAIALRIGSTDHSTLAQHSAMKANATNPSCRSIGGQCRCMPPSTAWVTPKPNTRSAYDGPETKPTLGSAANTAMVSHWEVVEGS